MGILDKVTKKDESKKATKKSKKTSKASGAKKDSKKKKDAVKADIHSSAYKILVQPHVTEKAAQFEANGKYVFRVAISSTKDDVKKAIRKVYGVSPRKVHMINVLGDKSRSGHKNRKPASYKKAIVTLKDGESIQIYEGV
jgi:large subunit ribosomal protein L23